MHFYFQCYFQEEDDSNRENPDFLAIGLKNGFLEIRWCNLLQLQQLKVVKCICQLVINKLLSEALSIVSSYL